MAWSSKGSLRGPKGDTGPVNSLSIGTVTETTGTPSATITGVYPNQKLNLVLKTGATGASGADGTDGASITVVVTTSPGSTANTLYLVPQ